MIIIATILLSNHSIISSIVVGIYPSLSLSTTSSHPMITFLKLSKFAAPDIPEPTPQFVNRFEDEPSADDETQSELVRKTKKRKWRGKIKRKRRRVGTSYWPNKSGLTPAVHEVFRMETRYNPEFMTVGRRIIREGEGHSEEYLQQVKENEEKLRQKKELWERRNPGKKYSPFVPVETDGSKDAGRRHRFLKDIPIETSGWEGDMPNPDDLPPPPEYDPEKERLEKERLKRDQNFWDWYESKDWKPKVKGMPKVVKREIQEDLKSDKLMKFMKKHGPTAFKKPIQKNPYIDPDTKKFLPRKRAIMLKKVRKTQRRKNIQKQQSIWPEGQHGRPFYPKDGPDHYAYEKVERQPNPLDEIFIQRRWTGLTANYRRKPLPPLKPYKERDFDEPEMSMVMAGYSDKQAHYRETWEQDAMIPQVTEAWVMWKVLAWTEEWVNPNTNQAKYHTHVLQPFTVYSETINYMEVWSAEWEFITWTVQPLLNHSVFPVVVRIKRPKVKKPIEPKKDQPEGTLKPREKVSLLAKEEEPEEVDQVTQTDWLPQIGSGPETKLMLEQPSVKQMSIASIPLQARITPELYFDKYREFCILYVSERSREDISDDNVTGHAFVIKQEAVKVFAQVAPWQASLRAYIKLGINKTKIDFRIDHIINIEDEKCEVRGLFAGGPTGQSRLTQYVLKDTDAKQKNITCDWLPDGVSLEDKYTRWERTGFFLGNGSLLGVYDCGEINGFGSLLKDQTFLIYHGDLAIAANYNKRNVTKVYRKQADQYDSPFPYPPNVIILSEGVHIVTIERQEWEEVGMSYRSAYFYRRDSADESMFTFQWWELMVDFGIYPNIGEESFIIDMDRIPDYRYFDHPGFQNYLLFGMYAAPECRPADTPDAHHNDRIISEYYNVWLPIWRTTQCGYVCSIQVDYYFRVLDPNSRADPSEEKYHNADVVRVVRTFANPLTRNQLQSIYSGASEDFPYFMKFKDMFNDAYFEPMRNALLMLITRPTGGNVVHLTVNPGQYTRRAQQFYTRHMNTGVSPPTMNLAYLKDKTLVLMQKYMRRSNYFRGPDQTMMDHQFALMRDYRKYKLGLQGTQQDYEAQEESHDGSQHTMEEERDYQQQPEQELTWSQKKTRRTRLKRKAQKEAKRQAEQQDQLGLQKTQATQQTYEPQEEQVEQQRQRLSQLSLQKESQDVSQHAMEEQINYQPRQGQQLTLRQRKNIRQRNNQLVRREAERQGPPRAQQQGPFRAQQQSPPRAPQQGPPRAQQQGPPRAQQQGPPRAQQQGPFRAQQQSPPRARQQGPPRAQQQGPFRAQQQSPPRARQQGPPRAQQQGPFRAQQQSPPRARQQGPPRAQQQGPFRAQQQSPPRARQQGPHRAQQQGPFRAQQQGPPRAQQQPRQQGQQHHMADPNMRGPSPFGPQSGTYRPPGFRQQHPANRPPIFYGPPGSRPRNPSFHRNTENDESGYGPSGSGYSRRR